MNESGAALNLKNSRLMRPVSSRKALLVLALAVILAGSVGATIAEDIRVLIACVVGAPILAILYALLMSAFSILVSRCLQFMMRQPSTQTRPSHVDSE